MPDNLRQFQQILDKSGLQAALRFLNGKAPHRYTGLFRFSSPLLSNVALADAWDDGASLLEAAPLNETFCGLVRSTEAAFQTDDATIDPRLSGHVLATNAVQSYCGVPLYDGSGELHGTLCHFDTRPCDIGHQAATLLEMAAPLVRDHVLSK